MVTRPYLVSLGLLAALLVLPSCDSLTSKTKANIHSFHTFYDNNEFEKIYDNSSQKLQKAIEKQKFITELTQKKQNLGRVVKIEQIEQLTPIFSKSQEIFIRQKTSFEKNSAIECFLFDASSGHLQLLEYSMTPLEVKDKSEPIE